MTVTPRLARSLACLALAAFGLAGPLGAQSPLGRPPSSAPDAQRARGAGAPEAPTGGTAAPTPPAGPQVRLALPPAQQQNTPAPAWWPLPDEQQARVQKLLAYWENHTKDIKTFRCDFTRWEYDPVFGPQDRPKSRSEGKICFAAPDRGLFKEEVVKFFTPPKEEGGEATYEVRPGEVGEYWVCDGKSVYEYRAQVKTVVEMKLPPEMQGSAIANSPLPFLFGAKADELNERYWIRELPPLPNYQAYRLEALPRSLDAQDFLRAEILLDQKAFLPVAMKLEKTRHQDGTVSYSALTFTNRQVNSAADKLANFVQLFVEPTIPWGWKKVVEDYRSGPPESQVQLPGPGERR